MDDEGQSRIADVRCTPDVHMENLGFLEPKFHSQVGERLPSWWLKVGLA